MLRDGVLKTVSNLPCFLLALIYSDGPDFTSINTIHPRTMPLEGRNSDLKPWNISQDSQHYRKLKLQYRPNPSITIISYRADAKAICTRQLKWLNFQGSPITSALTSAPQKNDYKI